MKSLRGDDSSNAMTTYISRDGMDLEGEGYGNEVKTLYAKSNQDKP